MTHKGKAKQLVKKFMKFAVTTDLDFEMGAQDYDHNTKQCALIAVDEIINLDNFSIEGREYWKQVKQEIEKI